MLFHNHLLVRAEVKEPMNTEAEGIAFLEKLVERINMKIIQGPFASYIDKPGNRGLTAIVMIETSHIAFHIWDEQDPALMQFDVYTCGELDVSQVFEIFEQNFNIVTVEYKLINRENELEVEGGMRWINPEYPEAVEQYKNKLKAMGMLETQESDFNFEQVDPPPAPDPSLIEARPPLENNDDFVEQNPPPFHTA